MRLQIGVHFKHYSATFSINIGSKLKLSREKVQDRGLCVNVTLPPALILTFPLPCDLATFTFAEAQG
jgi:hypothetical protein